MSHLSPREKQIADLLPRFLPDHNINETYALIGGELKISPRTVKFYTETLRLKLGVEKTRHLLAALRKLPD